MDARIARTRASLQDALLQLARERSLDEITVADIADRAGVNRSSFYQHYADKDVLLADALDAAVEEAGSKLVNLSGPVPEPPEDLLLYLRHIEQNASLYERVLGDRGSAVATARVRDRIEDVVIEAIGHAGVPAFEHIPVEVVAAGLAGSSLGVIRAWLSLSPRPPAEIAVGWLWQLLLGPGSAWTGEPTRKRTDPSRSDGDPSSG